MIETIKQRLYLGTAVKDRAKDYVDIFAEVTGRIPFVGHHDIMNHPSGPYYDIWDDVTKDEEREIRNKAHLLDIPASVRGAL